MRSVRWANCLKMLSRRRIGGTNLSRPSQRWPTAGDVVIVCVFTDEQVQQARLGRRSDDKVTMKPGSVVVLHTTGSPRTAETIAARADRHFIDVVDAPINSGSHYVAAGRVTLFVRGGDDAVDTNQPGAVQLRGPGAARRADRCWPAGEAHQQSALSRRRSAWSLKGVRLGRRLGVDESTLLAALPNGSAFKPRTERHRGRGCVVTFAAAVGDFIGKDVATIRKTVAELGSDMGGLDNIVDAGLKRQEESQ